MMHYGTKMNALNSGVKGQGHSVLRPAGSSSLWVEACSDWRSAIEFDFLVWDLA